MAGSGPNLYAYTGNNPVTFVDPLGTDSKGHSCFGGDAICDASGNVLGVHGLSGDPIFDSAVMGGAGAAARAAMGAAAAAEESAASIISRIAQQQANGGVDALRGLMSDAQQAAFDANPAAGSRFLGTAVHNATNEALQEAFPGRFIYQTAGPDFIDTTTGEMIELTTPGQVASHLAKAGYNGVTVSTYVLPKP